MKAREKRREHMDLVWEVVKRALEWHRSKDRVLKRAVNVVDLGKACAALEEFESELGEVVRS